MFRQRGDKEKLSGQEKNETEATEMTNQSTDPGLIGRTKQHATYAAFSSNKTKHIFRQGGQGERTRNQAPVPSAEWNKARIADTTSEVFKAMSRTGAGGDAYFALVALFCTADKMVVPVHCQESPITVEFHQPHDTGNKSTGFFGSSSTGRSKSWGSFHGSPSDSGGSRGGGAEDAHIVVTVPSTFDIYLRDGHLQSPRANGSSGITSVGRGGGSARGGGRGGDFHGGRRRGAGMNGKGVANGGGGLSVGGINGDHGGADASAAVHLVRVKAVVEEEIPVVRSKKTPALSVNGLSGNRASSAPVGDMAAAAASGRQNVTMSSQQGSDRRAEHSSQAATAAVPSPGSVLARTQRRMRVSIVPEPSAMTQMMHSLSRKIGVGDGTGPEPPRVLGM